MRMARSDSSVLITGENGTGKEMFAQAIHNASSRQPRQFVAVNCGAIPGDLLESELFGYEEGAFTGASKGGKTGIFEMASTGTLFLDEISEMDMALQKKLLRALQEKEVVRVGGNYVIPVNCRIIASSNRDLGLMGVGTVIGAGIFVITGVAAATYAGPALIFSFIIAGLCCGFAALGYAELSSSIPAAGSSYTYAYVGLGEIFGWFIGWCITLEYVVAMSAISVGWSAYATNIIRVLGINLPDALALDPSAGGIVNLPAIVIIAICGILQLKGAKTSAKVNNVLVIIKLSIIVLFIVLVATHIDPANYHPFMWR